MLFHIEQFFSKINDWSAHSEVVVCVAFVMYKWFLANGYYLFYGLFAINSTLIQMEASLFVDNTALFRARVKAIKLRQTASSRQRLKPNSELQEDDGKFQHVW